jgi:hypothetical protein
MKQKFLIKVFILNILLLLSLHAQKPPLPSPRDSVKATFDGKKISISYGKPSMKGRKIFGDKVRYYHVWRTGDGAATTFLTEADLEMDGAIVPRGTYSLFTLPSEDHWKLIINKQTGQWGTEYSQRLDLARIDITVKKLKSPVEYLTFKLEKNSNTDGVLKIEWERTSLSVPFHISKDVLIPSPRDSSVIVLNDKRIVVDYGRPSMRGRKIMGGVVPYGSVWRTGANAATSMTTQADLLIGGVSIPKGTYSLFTLPSSKHWKLIINKQTGQWGTVYNEKLDVARLTLKKRILKQPIEKFTISLDRKNDRTCILKLIWEKTELSTEIKIP